ncbi:MFS general substrate transporter [Teratosphaeria nubilosa]|uniref:MFS general substrate transporter n=1 Tax=Teratosphaeria nubilosa TaxID=161662 RepID=A0A6G1KW96_9PEZI|nr:MFS general substrate transporter [Teratosphaeria nubilosa]
MAYATAYMRVDGKGDAQSSSSQELHLARYTPELDSDDGDDLEELEAGQGYELKKYGQHSKERSLRKGRPLDVKDTPEDEEGEDAGNETAGLARRSHRSRAASVQFFELCTPDDERAVRRKLDTHIGNAKIAGLTDDLSLSNDQYKWLLTIFYITYVLFEWMTLCYKIFPPHVYISCCVCAWGVLASLQAITISWAGLLVLRGLLGIGEAAFVGIPFYLSFFFRKDELAFRIGLFISAAPLATSFASSLAWAIGSLGDRTGIASWRLLFLLEGFPACLVAVWAWSWLPDEPATARWLTPRERKIATLRMRKEARSDGFSYKKSSNINISRHIAKFQWAEVFRTLSDLKAYLMAAMFFCCNVAFSSMPVFLPTILSSMGFSQLGSQGMAAPPFLFAFITVLLTTFISDRAKSRSIPMIIHGLLAASGYVVLASAEFFQLEHTVR